MGIPVRVDHNARAAEWRRSFVGDATVRVLSRLRKTSADEVRLELRSPVTPTKVGDLPGGTVAQLMVLADDSALAEIIGEAIRVDMTGISQFNLTYPTNFSSAGFVEEDHPIPAVTGILDSGLIPMVKKLALLAPLTNELEYYSAPTASVVISRLLRISVGNGGVKVLLSADPETPAAPAGILNGIPPIAAGASPSADINALISAIAANNISTRSIFFVAAPAQASALAMQPWPNFKRKVIECNMLAAGTIIAIAADGFVVGGEGSPVIDVSKGGAFHLANPASPIMPVGGPMAAPVVSMFQTDSFALRCVCRITWGCAPGSVAWIQNASW